MDVNVDHGSVQEARHVDGVPQRTRRILRLFLQNELVARDVAANAVQGGVRVTKCCLIAQLAAPVRNLGTSPTTTLTDLKESGCPTRVWC